jgi:dihydroorotate dehydrogenase electron transfer subunit
MSAGAKPGQFGMVWVPGVDEIPLSLLPEGKEEVTIAVKYLGEGSRALMRKRSRELIGIRGPYGQAFTWSDWKSVLMVAGGTGTVPMLALLRRLVTKGVECSFVLGASASNELLFANEIQQLSTESGGTFSVTTDDGSAGAKGLATDATRKLLHAKSFDQVYTCGPEIMMKKVVGLSMKIHVPVEAGLERIFKCGAGVCGSCCIGPYLVCRDGPVFGGQVLKELLEFGRATRDSSGRSIQITKT